MSSDKHVDIRAVEQLRRHIEAAENAGDAESIAVMFDAEAVAMVPDFPVQEGGPACATFIRDLLPGLVAHFDRRITYVGAEIQIADHLAFDRGTFSFTIVPRSGGTVETVTGKYFWVYRRAPDATWKLLRMLVTRDEPADSQQDSGDLRRVNAASGFARLATSLALPFAAVLAIGETVRNWGDWGWWPIWVVAYAAAALLATSWVVERRDHPRASAVTSAAWGFTAAMVLMTFLSRIDPSADSEHGPLPPRLLTLATAALLLVALLAAISSVADRRGSGG